MDVWHKRAGATLGDSPAGNGRLGLPPCCHPPFDLSPLRNRPKPHSPSATLALGHTLPRPHSPSVP
eukprot:359663-Chlamydomonas_euryale.AAC.3